MKHIVRRKLFKYILAVLIGFYAIDNVQAQDVASGLATATVMTALSVLSTQDLNFGSVFQGVAKSVANTDAASAGIFTITGAAGAGISTYMSLPQYIATSTGDDRMNISFRTNDLSIDSTLNTDPSAFGDGWQDVDPNNIPNGLVVGSDAVSHTMFFLGGRVTPAIDQTAGAYTANIIVTVAYNGL